MDTSKSCARRTALFGLALVYAGQAGGQELAAIGSAASPAAPLEAVQAPGLAASAMGLRRLIAEAIRRHPSVRAAEAQKTQAHVQVGIARLQFLPTPSVDVNVQRSGPVATAVPSVTATLSQPLWSAGGLTAGLRGAKDREAAAGYSVAEAQNTIALQVIAAYEAWKSATLLARVQQVGIERLLDKKRLIDRRIVAGASSSADAALVASRLAQANSDLASSQANARAGLAALGELLGRPVPAEDLDPRFDQLPIKPCGMIIEQAMSDNPTILRLEKTVAAAEQDARAQHAAKWPTLSLQGSLVRYIDGSQAKQGFLTLRFSPGAGLTAFRQGRYADAGAESARQSLEAARRQLSSQISSQCEAYQAARGQLDGLRQALDANATVYDSFTRLFLAGKRSWLDLVNQIREVTGVQQALTVQEVSLEAASWNLLLLSGQTLEEDDQ